MRKLVFAALTAVLLTVGIASPAGASSRVVATGSFVAQVQPPFELQDVGPNRCLLTVPGSLKFSGTLAGVATGTTEAFIFAACTEVAVTPPGTFFDLFRFQGTFSGTVRGEPVTATLTYQGVTRPGGAISATITLRDGAHAALAVDAVVLVGGTYAGVAIV